MQEWKFEDDIHKSDLQSVFVHELEQHVQYQHHVMQREYSAKTMALYLNIFWQYEKTCLCRHAVTNNGEEGTIELSALGVSRLIRRDLKFLEAITSKFESMTVIEMLRYVQHKIRNRLDVVALYLCGKPTFVALFVTLVSVDLHVKSRYRSHVFCKGKLLHMNPFWTEQVKHSSNHMYCTQAMTQKCNVQKHYVLHLSMRLDACCHKHKKLLSVVGLIDTVATELSVRMRDMNKTIVQHNHKAIIAAINSITTRLKLASKIMKGDIQNKLYQETVEHTLYAKRKLCLVSKHLDRLRMWTTYAYNVLKKANT